MAKKKNIPAAVEAPACGGELPARDLSQEAQIASLKELNSLLLNRTVESREQIHQLRSQLASTTADQEILDATERDVVRLVLCSSLSDAAARCAAEMSAATETAEKMRRQKDEDLDMLKAENKGNASKRESLEEECRLLKEIRGQLEKEVGNLEISLKELKADIKKSYVSVEVLDKTLIEYGRLEKEKLDLEMAFYVAEGAMTLKINELKGNMTKMAAEKNLVDQRNAEYEIQIRNLHAEVSKIQSARESLEDVHRSSSEKFAINCAAMQRETNLKAEETEALKMQLNESTKDKHIMEITIEELQKVLNHLTTENEETRKHLDSLIVEKDSLKKHLETSNQGVWDIEKKLKTLKDASGQAFAMLNKITTEVMDEERIPENGISRETGEVENDEEMKLFVDNLEAIKLAVKGKDSKIKDLNQKLELLKLSEAYAKNKGGILKWVFPATTTIFAAVSLAYAARAR